MTSTKLNPTTFADGILRLVGEYANTRIEHSRAFDIDERIGLDLHAVSLLTQIHHALLTGLAPDPVLDAQLDAAFGPLAGAL